MTQWVAHLMEDHTRIERALVMIDRQLAREDGFDAATTGALLDFLYEYGERFHNQKEEQFLFPRLGELGLPTQGGPIAVMLSEHQMERDFLKELIPQTKLIKEKSSPLTDGYLNSLRQYIALTKDHIWKENDILYPMGRRATGDSDDTWLMGQFASLLSSMPYQGAGYVQRWETMIEAVENSSGGQVDLLAQLPTSTIRSMLDALPIELTFIDTDDTVRYFNKVDDVKIFPRTLSVVGRRVQQCHPPKSVHLVQRIIDEMKAGRRESAAFWIPFGEKKEMFLHISYHAVRDREGNYLGCVELNQDVAPYRAIEGTSRTLESLS